MQNEENKISAIPSEVHREKLESLSPKISIIIPVFNQLEYTKQCIETVWETCSKQNYEIIVIDDCSTDGTHEYLESLKTKVRSYRNEKNQGFILNCNYAATQARGEYIVLLNNDTIPQDNWLEGLLEPFSLYDKVAATGAFMIFPNNTVLEASSIVFSDGSGWNYGRGDNPESSRYNFIREVDYVPGGGMMIPKKIWDEFGGLDTHYCPAYYDDIDFCFRVRKAGYKVLHTPFARIIHFEGMSGGTDTTKGLKRYQVINQEKFRERWKDELKNQYENKYENVFRASWRGNGKRILLIDHILPLPNFNSGCLRMNHIVKSLVRQGHKVTFVSLSSSDPENYKNTLRKMGVETLSLNYETWEGVSGEKKYAIIEHILNSLEVYNNNYDIVYMAFYWIANHFIRNIRKRLPNAIMYVDSVDIHFLRKQREAEISKYKEHYKIAAQTKIDELAVYNRADAVIVVTEDDKKILLKELPNKPVLIIPNAHDVAATETNFQDRKDLLFVGGFNHTPNVDSMLFFCNEVFPKVEEKIPGIKLWIVGSNPTDEVKALGKNSVIVTGWVNETKPYLEKCRISIAPLRYGAGMKGKVGEAMSHGLPVITTSVGSEGIGIVNDVHAIIVNEVNEWVEQIERLYFDQNLWEKLSANGKKLIDDLYGSAALDKKTKFMLELNSREDVARLSPNPSKCSRIYTDINVAIVIVTYNQIEFTKRCIDGIVKNTTIPYRIIIVDNASRDNTRNYLHTLQGTEIILNNINYGFPAACNQGIRGVHDEYVLILNNDTIVTEGWLERLIEVAESDPQIGLVGPISNEVSGLQKDENAKYNSIEEMHSYAAGVAEKNKDEILNFPRIAFLCTLIKKEVIEKIGGLDERFSPGNYEDDDFCLRAQLAGYKTVIAKDVFIHHFGSKSFKANGLDAYKKRLEINKQIFIEKWGVTPDELWLKNNPIKEHSIVYPINKNLFKQYFDRTQIHLHEKELELAKSSVQKAVENFREGDAVVITFDELCNIAGNIHLAVNDIEKAKEYFEQELNVNPTSSSACKGLGDVFLAQENLEAAKTMYEWAVKNSPSNDNALGALARVNEILGLEVNHMSVTE